MNRPATHLPICCITIPPINREIHHQTRNGGAVVNAGWGEITELIPIILYIPVNYYLLILHHSEVCVEIVLFTELVWCFCLFLGFTNTIDRIGKGMQTKD